MEVFVRLKIKLPSSVFLVSAVLLSSCGEGSEEKRKESPYERFEKRATATSPVETIVAPSVTAGPTSSASPYNATLAIGRCGRVRRNCVVDGDTLWLEGVKIRVADIDTPEIGSPSCPEEKRMGERATNRFIELLNGGRVTVARASGPDEDRYGRKLRIILIDGVSVGDRLVEEGLAHEWRGVRDPWC